MGRRWIACCLLVLGAGGCDHDDVVEGTARSGVIRGQIADGGDADAQVRIVAATTAGQDPSYLIETVTDPSGRFELAVPNGRYRVFLRPYSGPPVYFAATGPTLDVAAADPVIVTGDDHACEFRCGRLQVSVDLAPGLTFDTLQWRVVPLAVPDSSFWQLLPWSGSSTAEMRFLPPGEYLQLLASPGRVRAYFPGVVDAADADVVTVTAGEAWWSSLEVPGPTSISGAVTGSWQTLGLAPPEVSLWCGDEWLATTAANDDGGFAFSLLGGGRLRVRVAAAGGGEAWIGGPAAVHEVPRGDSVAGVDRVESGLECAFAAGDAPAGAVGLVLDDGGAVLARLTQTIGHTWRCANLDPGPVRLRIEGDGSWPPQYFDRRETFASADPIAIPPDGGIARVTVTVDVRGRDPGRP